jgi:Sigma-70, region 4
MASLDSLPADQRAVLQLVLQRGRTYDDIAKLLSIDRAAVRQRALGAFDALGPRTDVPAERRALIADYVLGQLPEQVSDTTRERLAESPSERAWARVVASELAPLATDPLPEIPVEPRRAEPAPEGRRRRSDPERSERRERPEPARVAAAATHDDTEHAARRTGLGGEEPPPERRISRRGGAIVLGLAAAVVVIAVIVIIVATSGGSSKKPSTQASTTPPTTTPAAGTNGTTTTGSTTSTTATKVLAQINLTPPSSSSKAAGIAEVLRQGATNGIAIVAQGMTPNTKHDAYAVWLYNSPADAVLLGFVNPGVGKNGRLSTAGALPSSASRFKHLVVTLETQAKPKQPGTIVLQGTLTGLS